MSNPQSPDRVKLHILFAAMGFAAASAQILIMRRFIVVFGGNELVAGGVFAGWLGFSCLGNVLTGRIADRVENAGVLVFSLLAAMAASVPVTIALSYLAKPLIGIPAPVMIGPWSALALSAALMAPCGLLIGASFAACARLAGKHNESSVPTVYLMDAIGAAAGGLAITLLALRYLTPLQSSLVTASLIAAAAGIALGGLRIKAAALACMAAVAAAMFFSGGINRSLADALWRGFNPVLEMESLFSSLMVTDNRGERTLFADGQPIFSLPLDYTYESIVGLPLIMHKNPKSVAMIEGGLSGTAAQWSMWNLEKAFFLRLDPDVTWLEENAMPSSVEISPPWLALHHGDGRSFIRKASFGDCEGACLDVITVNVGTPDTASADRYFTLEFFREARAALKNDGVLCLWMLKPQSAIGPEAKEMLGSVMATLEAVFPKVVMLPLDRFYFFASDKGALTDSIAELIARLDASGVDSPYLGEQVLAGVFQERIDWFAGIVKEAAAASPLNRDAHPRAFFNSMLLWERRFGSGSPALSSRARSLRPWMAYAAIALVAAVAFAVPGRSGARMRIMWALAAAGFASISYQLALLVHCQMVMGVMVYRLGLIIAAFMAGAGAGAWFGLSTRIETVMMRRALAAALVFAALMCLIMFFTASLSFTASNLMMGFACGFIYQAAAKMLFLQRPSAGVTAGAAQGADLAGAMAGSIFTGLAAIPLFGLQGTLAIAAASLVSAAVVVLARE